MASTHLPKPTSIKNQLNAEMGGSVNASVSLSPVIPASSPRPTADTNLRIDANVSIKPVVSPLSQHANVGTDPRVKTSASFDPTSSRPFKSRPRWHNPRWIKYKLPDGTVYYHHPTRRVTADVDLSSDSILGIITAFLERQDGGSVSPEVELWIRWGRKSTRDLFMPMGYWVDHRKRVVQSCENTMIRNMKGKNAMADDCEWYIYISLAVLKCR